MRRRVTYQRGNTLVMVAASMTVILALAALGVDLVSFYAARSEAQRSADAAALAGATFWSRSGCTSSSSGCSGFQTGAMSAAMDIGNQNLIAGVSPNIQSGDFLWPTSPASNPQIRVTVQRTAARGNALPTFFAKILGFSSVDVSATATAEAYNPGAKGPTVGNLCVKPWLIPDPRIKNPNALGTQLTIDPANTQGQFPLILPAGTASAECPTCSGANNNPYRQSIECCNTRRITCGSVTLQVASNNVQQDTRTGVKCLIHQSNGQPDSLNGTSPFTITGGNGNPNSALRGQIITASDSLVTVPIYNGSSSSSCSKEDNDTGCLVTANITGFMQLFIRNVDDDDQGKVQTTITNISSCGGNNAVITGGGLSPVAVRLVL